MKKLFVVLAFFFATGVTVVCAQDTAKPKKQGFSWSKQYMDEIGIAPEVQEKIEAVKKENDAETKAVRNNNALSADDKAAQLKELTIKRQQGIFSLVSPEQLKKSTEIIARIRASNAAAGQ